MLIGGDFELIVKIFNSLVLGVNMCMLWLFLLVINIFFVKFKLSFCGYIRYFSWWLVNIVEYIYVGVLVEYVYIFLLELFMIVILWVL